jgi:hypothetical protein
MYIIHNVYPDNKLYKFIAISPLFQKPSLSSLYNSTFNWNFYLLLTYTMGNLDNWNSDPGILVLFSCINTRMGMNTPLLQR